MKKLAYADLWFKTVSYNSDAMYLFALRFLCKQGTIFQTQLYLNQAISDYKFSIFSHCGL